MTVRPLDEGDPCPGPLGGRWHHIIEVDGRVWRKGDRFFILDRHKVPRPFTFVYHYTGDGSTVCYSRQRFRGMPNGLVTMVPYETDVTMNPQQLEAMQLSSDLEDLGLIGDALQLRDTLDAPPDEVKAAIQHAREVIDQHEEEED